ncbi:hypothetical protein DFQ30_011223, partial [Apophysomyces sp. BC1015]
MLYIFSISTHACQYDLLEYVDLFCGRVLQYIDNQLTVLQDNGRQQTALRMPTSLSEALRNSSSIMFPTTHSKVIDGDEYALMVVNHRSNRHPNNDCSAGEEGVLYALRLRDGIAKPDDHPAMPGSAGRSIPLAYKSIGHTRKIGYLRRDSFAIATESSFQARRRAVNISQRHMTRTQRNALTSHIDIAPMPLGLTRLDRTRARDQALPACAASQRVVRLAIEHYVLAYRVPEIPILHGAAAAKLVAMCQRLDRRDPVTVIPVGLIERPVLKSVESDVLEGFLQSAYLRFMRFEQTQAGPHNVASRTVATGQHLCIDEFGEVIAKMDVSGTDARDVEGLGAGTRRAARTPGEVIQAFRAETTGAGLRGGAAQSNRAQEWLAVVAVDWRGKARR